MQKKNLQTVTLESHEVPQRHKAIYKDNAHDKLTQCQIKSDSASFN